MYDETCLILGFCWIVPLLLVIAATQIAYGVSQGMGQRGLEPNQPHCGRCRYIVRGIGSWRCPECGADLHKVGLRYHGDRQPFPLASRVLIWTVALPGPALVVCNLITAIVGPSFFATPEYGKWMVIVAIAVAAVVWVTGMQLIARAYARQMSRINAFKAKRLAKFGEQIDQAVAALRGVSGGGAGGGATGTSQSRSLDS